MDLSFSDEDEAFRAQVRSFIEREFDAGLRRRMAQSRNGYLDKEGQRKWHKALYRQGWAAPNWPKDHGGAGWTPTQRYLFEVETEAAGAPHLLRPALRMVAPVLMAFGTERQKKEHLPTILNGDTFWCQGYSEPQAGSDLASLAMKAEDKGDHFLCNGTKIWTSFAQWADWTFCLVRTDPNARKRQEGISFLLIDMSSPGIAVDPIATLDMPAPGQQEINQMFFQDVKVPKENLVGEINKGWTYAKYLLEFERANAYGPPLKHGLARLRQIAESEAAGTGRKLVDDPDFWQRMKDLEIRIMALDYTELRVFSKLSAGQRPGPESSLLKVQGTELLQAVSELAVEAAGAYAAPLMRDTWEDATGPRSPSRIGPDYAAPVAPSYFNARKLSIYAGSNEIQRNIIARLMLGL